MWFKAAEGSGMAVWTMAGLGITLAFLSSRVWVDYCNKKLNVTGQEVDENGIDQLPDDILCNIVSWLRSIEASRTSILSRRWRNIWTLNPRLILSCLHTFDTLSKYRHDLIAFNDRQRFLKAVDQCLELYSSRKLKTFLLHCCFSNDHTDHLVRWMQSLVRLDVEELFLGHTCETCNGDRIDRVFTFSFKLIDGLSKLRLLDLVSCDVETNFVSRCNSLVDLNLFHLSLQSHKLSDILLSCPNLRNLYIKHCELPRNLRISGSHLKLEMVRLLVCYNVEKLEISDINVTNLMIDINSEVEISLTSVPKLEILHLRTHRMNYCFGDDVLPRLNALLVQTSYQMWPLPSKFRVFRNIKILCLMTRGVPNPESCKEVDLWNFAPVLSAFSLLEEFSLEAGGHACKQERKAEEWPVLRHEHLRLMELSGFSNTQNELEFAIFILTSAHGLKSLVLTSRFRRYNGDDFYFKNERRSKRLEAQVVDLICANLQRHAPHSMCAEVTLDI